MLNGSSQSPTDPLSRPFIELLRPPRPSSADQAQSTDASQSLLRRKSPSALSPPLTDMAATALQLPRLWPHPATCTSAEAPTALAPSSSSTSPQLPPITERHLLLMRLFRPLASSTSLATLPPLVVSTSSRSLTIMFPSLASSLDSQRACTP